MASKGIYVGPPHFWHHYALNPRERYYYGYYGMYGPDTDLSQYEPIKEEFRWSDGCYDNKTVVEAALEFGSLTMIGTIIYMLTMLLVVTCVLKLVLHLLLK